MEAYLQHTSFSRELICAFESYLMYGAEVNVIIAKSRVRSQGVTFWREILNGRKTYRYTLFFGCLLDKLLCHWHLFGDADSLEESC